MRSYINRRNATEALSRFITRHAETWGILPDGFTYDAARLPHRYVIGGIVTPLSLDADLDSVPATVARFLDSTAVRVALVAGQGASFRTVGVWWDSEARQYVLDVVESVADLDWCRTLLNVRGEICAFDAATGHYVYA